uniref:Serine protease 12 n=1 Tax=Anas platyrhynchos platyrhynchos TaxID=8840 RepID=U3I058_ANAPP
MKKILVHIYLKPYHGSTYTSKNEVILILFSIQPHVVTMLGLKLCSISGHENGRAEEPSGPRVLYILLKVGWAVFLFFFFFLIAVSQLESVWQVLLRSVRLQGGKNEFEGTVEVYLNGVWGTICGSHWDNNDATVVCRQLALGEKGTAKHIPFSGLGVIPVYWSEVRCRGDEATILSCEKDIWQDGTCPQKVAAAVTCSSSLASVFTLIRLAGGNNAYEGRVEVYHAGQWGTICDDQWDDADAEVVCRQLGLGGVAKAWSQAYFGEGSGPVLLDEVRCTGNELSIEQCPKSSWQEHNCGHKEDAGVSCTPLADGALRLTSGKGGHEGRLEVYYTGQWGTICDDGWTELNTQVVCRQLGFKYGKSVPESYSEGNSAPIWLDDVSCSGKETNLLQCSRREWGEHDCSHQEDIRLICYPDNDSHKLSLGKADLWEHRNGSNAVGTDPSKAQCI